VAADRLAVSALAVGPPADGGGEVAHLSVGQVRARLALRLRQRHAGRRVGSEAPSAHGVVEDGVHEGVCGADVGGGQAAGGEGGDPVGDGLVRDLRERHGLEVGGEAERRDVARTGGRLEVVAAVEPSAGVGTERNAPGGGVDPRASGQGGALFFLPAAGVDLAGERA